MTYRQRAARRIAAAALMTAVLFGTARAEDGGEPESWGRYELWMGPVFWPALEDIRAQQGGFDSVGLGLGLGLHFPYRRFEDSDLLLGFDLSVSGVDSDIDGFFSTVMARHLFVGVSAKWLFGSDRNVSLDAGFGYHEADIADVSTVYWGVENELWSESSAGAWIGATWDVSRGLPGRRNGLFVSAKAHFVDFDEVRGDDVLSGPVFGDAAGRLDGPIYVLEIGYSGR